LPRPPQSILFTLSTTFADPLLEAIRTALAVVGFEVLVVDDASSDGTGEAVNEKTREHTNVSLVQRRAKLGLFSAVLEGAARSAGNLVIMMDADLSHDPQLLPLLIKQIESGSDVAIGSRYVAGARLDGWPFYRRIGSLAGPPEPPRFRWVGMFRSNGCR
jgi:dolichol-phosphate mannosyltransferase